MDASLDVFVILGDGNFVWIGCARTENEAIELMRTQEKTNANRFFIHSLSTGHRTFYSAQRESDVIQLELQP
jgi:hypothetical protein